MAETNLITGFPGNGETTSILHLLARKNPNGKWTVLINELREARVDGVLPTDSGTLLKEIPGGCTYCANSLPIQIGLSVLLRWGKPDRLLIKPIGLSHPKQILGLLTAPVYEPWIDLYAALYILNPRLLLDERNASNEDFRDRLAAAGTIVANKSDRATPKSEQALECWWQRNGGDRQLIHSEHGEIDGHLLNLSCRNLAKLSVSATHSHQYSVKKGLAALSLPEH